ncbi:hypothetical protein GCM10027440_06110 [Nocardiopsis coralliicola]
MGVTDRPQRDPRSGPCAECLPEAGKERALPPALGSAAAPLLLAGAAPPAFPGRAAVLTCPVRR